MRLILLSAVVFLASCSHDGYEGGQRPVAQSAGMHDDFSFEVTDAETVQRNRAFAECIARAADPKNEATIKSCHFAANEPIVDRCKAKYANSGPVQHQQQYFQACEQFRWIGYRRPPQVNPERQHAQTNGM